jgi:hypothetical protein
MSSRIAVAEKSALVPGTPEDLAALSRELRGLAGELRVAEVLTTWQDAIRRLPTQNSQGAAVFILSVDPVTKTAQAIGFRELSRML